MSKNFPRVCGTLSSTNTIRINASIFSPLIPICGNIPRIFSRMCLPAAHEKISMNGITGISCRSSGPQYKPKNAANAPHKITNTVFLAEPFVNKKSELRIIAVYANALKTSVAEFLMCPTSTIPPSKNERPARKITQNLILLLIFLSEENAIPKNASMFKNRKLKSCEPSPLRERAI